MQILKWRWQGKLFENMREKFVSKSFPKLFSGGFQMIPQKTHTKGVLCSDRNTVLIWRINRLCLVVRIDNVWGTQHLSCFGRCELLQIHSLKVQRFGHRVVPVKTRKSPVKDWSLPQRVSLTRFIPLLCCLFSGPNYPAFFTLCVAGVSARTSDRQHVWLFWVDALMSDVSYQ